MAVLHVTARALIAVLAAGGHDPGNHLGAGVVLQPGEVPLTHGGACLTRWDAQAAQVTRGRVRRRGRQFESAAQEVAAVSGWKDHCDVAFLATSLCLVGRAQPVGQLLSIWWTGWRIRPSGAGSFRWRHGEPLIHQANEVVSRANSNSFELHVGATIPIGRRPWEQGREIES